MNRTKEQLTSLAFALVLVIGGCAALNLNSVTPAQRAATYQREGQAGSVACKAYKFDRALGLTNEAPAMTELCGVTK